MTATDLLRAADMHLSASSAMTGEPAAFYCASARVAFEQAKERLAQIERMLLAREAELVAAVRVKDQQALALDGGVKK